MKQYNKSIILIYIYLIANSTFAQSITKTLHLDSCYEMAKRNYPLVKQYNLISKTKEYSLENANKRYLPVLNISGQATYQSEVTQIPISLPNVNIETLSKDQYRLYGEISQSITELYTIKDQKELIQINSNIEDQKIEVELYKLKERINNIFFGILLLDAQIQQTELLKKDIQIGIEKVDILINNGVALKSSSDILKVELIKANQKIIELKSNRNGFADMLSIFINQKIEENTILVQPLQQIISNSINRPELKMFELQKSNLDIQNELLYDKLLPQVSLFFQAGLGRPTLNMLSNEISGYYIGGLRLNWNMSNLYTFENDKNNLINNQNSLDIQKDIFIFNTNITIQQQKSEVSKFLKLIESDQNIISLRESIKDITRIQLEEGTCTSNDYWVAVNAQDQALQNYILHKIQLLLAQYNQQITSGN